MKLFNLSVTLVKDETFQRGKKEFYDLKYSFLTLYKIPNSLVRALMPKAVVCNKWRCGACHRKQTTSSDKCVDCGARKSIGTSLIVLHGDWNCSVCGNNNFARRTECYKCHLPQNALPKGKVVYF